MTSRPNRAGEFLLEPIPLQFLATTAVFLAAALLVFPDLMTGPAVRSKTLFVTVKILREHGRVCCQTSTESARTIVPTLQGQLTCRSRSPA